MNDSGVFMQVSSIAWILAGGLVGSVLTGAVLAGDSSSSLDRQAVSGGATAPYRRLTTPRIKPLELSELTAEQREALGANKNPNLNVRTALYEPELGKRWWSWLTFVWNSNSRGDAAIPMRDKELVILRVNWLCHDDWVWGQHVPIAKREGRTDEEIARIPKGPNAPGWNDADATLLRAVDELHTAQFISDATWQ